MKKILFFKPGAIGDFLHTLPALRVLKTRFPAASIAVMVSPGVDSLIQGTGLAHQVLVFDKAVFRGRIGDLVRFGFRIRSEHFDLFVDMQPSPRSFLLRRLSGIRHILVYTKHRWDKTRSRRIHAVDNFLDTLAPLGVPPATAGIDLPLQDAARERVDQFLRLHRPGSDRPLIALNCSVGAARPARNWYPDRFALLADRIADELGADAVFVGGGEDVRLVEDVMAGMKTRALSAAGILSLAETAALLKRCTCLISSDTGPLHLATAVQTPVIGLYGSTDPRRTGPVGSSGHIVISRDLPCVPCEKKECPLGTRACMDAISVQDVFTAVRRMLP